MEVHKIYNNIINIFFPTVFKRSSCLTILDNRSTIWCRYNACDDYFRNNFYERKFVFHLKNTINILYNRRVQFDYTQHNTELKRRWRSGVNECSCLHLLLQRLFLHVYALCLKFSPTHKKQGNFKKTKTKQPM